MLIFNLVVLVLAVAAVPCRNIGQEISGLALKVWQTPEDPPAVRPRRLLPFGVISRPAPDLRCRVALHGPGTEEVPGHGLWLVCPGIQGGISWQGGAMLRARRDRMRRVARIPALVLLVLRHGACGTEVRVGLAGARVRLDGSGRFGRRCSVRIRRMRCSGLHVWDLVVCL